MTISLHSLVRLFVLLQTLLPTSNAFQLHGDWVKKYTASFRRRRHHSYHNSLALTSSDELLDLIRSSSSSSSSSSSLPSPSLENTTEESKRIADGISFLESSFESPSDDDLSRFEQLVGYYTVSFVQSSRPKDNPVGGQWTRSNGLAQRLLRTRRTFQHILPRNSTGVGARMMTTTTTTRTPLKQGGGGGKQQQRHVVIGEVINVISLEALFGLLRVTVVLRGDCVPLTMEERTNTTRVIQPLSSLAVKALFDSPRIILGQTGRVFNLALGPRSLVLLDTNYCDDNLRIGMGGTSGTRFVFARCKEGDELDEANEFMTLIKRKPVKKIRALLVLGVLASMSAYGGYVTKRIGLRLMGGIVCVLSLLLGSFIATASGGIERDDRGVLFRNEENASASSQVSQLSNIAN